MSTLARRCALIVRVRHVRMVNTEVGAMPLIDPISRQTILGFVVAVVAAHQHGSRAKHSEAAIESTMPKRSALA